MNTRLLERLDEIARLEPQLINEEELLELMEQYIDEAGALRTLVEKYGHTRIPILARTVSYILASASESPNEETIDAVLFMIKELRCKEDDGTLENCLTAIANLIESPPLRVRFFSPNLDLFSFLMHCLSSSATTVQYGALQIISLLYWNGLLFTAFTQPQINLICTKLTALANLHEELLDLELESLAPLLTLTARGVEKVNTTNFPHPYEKPLFEFLKVDKATAAGELVFPTNFFSTKEQQLWQYEANSISVRGEKQLSVKRLSEKEETPATQPTIYRVAA